MPTFPCGHHGCSYTASTRTGLHQHRKRHSSAGRSRGALEHALRKTETSLRNVKAAAREIGEVNSLLGRLPKNVSDYEIGPLLSGIRGPTLEGQARALSATAQRLRNTLSQMPRRGGSRRATKGGRRTRRR
jgi:hypothetical protein